MIIESTLDNDTYKFTMQQGVLHQFSDAMVEYKFQCRTANIDFINLFDTISRGIRDLACLKFEDSELNYLSSLRFIKPDYIDFLRHFQFDPKKYIQLYMIGGLGWNQQIISDLELRIKGPWLQTILFEVPVLAIISEVYTTSQPDFDLLVGERNLNEKIRLLKKSNLLVQFADFGTRRRATRDGQDHTVETLSNKLPHNFVGTSNVYFAKKHNVTPTGTMAHEWTQAHQALGYRLIDSQRMAFENWAKEYRGDLGIALSDTLGVDVFLRDFDLYLAKLFDGVRQDSGSPEDFLYKMVDHYKNLRIDPKSKTIVFSDGLNFDRMLHLHRLAENVGINSSFGIGTNLTNDCGTKPIQIVIKMVSCNNQPVAKISDSPGKGMCEDSDYEKYLKKVFNIGEQ